jgi:inhibitor of cysteine peptidase
MSEYKHTKTQHIETQAYTTEKGSIMVKKTFALMLATLIVGTGTVQAATLAANTNATTGAAKTLAAKTHTINLSVANNNGSKTIKKGDVITVTLEANSSTGYTWDVASNNKRVLRYNGKKYIAPKASNPPMVGTAGKEVLSFKAIGRGTSTLKLVYHQPWDKKAKPAKTFTVKLTVKK